MDFDLNDDERALDETLRSIATRHAHAPNSTTAFHIYSEALDDELAANGVFDPEMLAAFGPIAPALAVMAVAQLPVTVEVAASVLILPAISGDRVRRPLALMSGPADPIVRFLPQARTALVDLGSDLIALPVTAGQVVAQDSLFAYPVGRLADPDLAGAVSLGAGAVAPFRQARRLGLALELWGALRAALDATLVHVTDRRQFNRAIGSFQAVQHRLAECEEIVESARLLALRAAWSGDPADAALAAAFIQGEAARIVYDCHQFHGAIGITLEHSLHFWTFRARLLQGELGSALAQAKAAAEQLWT